MLTGLTQADFDNGAAAYGVWWVNVDPAVSDLQINLAADSYFSGNVLMVNLTAGGVRPGDTFQLRSNGTVFASTTLPLPPTAALAYNAVDKTLAFSLAGVAWDNPTVVVAGSGGDVLTQTQVNQTNAASGLLVISLADPQPWGQLVSVHVVDHGGTTDVTASVELPSPTLLYNGFTGIITLTWPCNIVGLSSDLQVTLNGTLLDDATLAGYEQWPNGFGGDVVTIAATDLATVGGTTIEDIAGSNMLIEFTHQGYTVSLTGQTLL